jgi:hypothetical protein
MLASAVSVVDPEQQGPADADRRCLPAPTAEEENSRGQALIQEKVIRG